MARDPKICCRRCDKPGASELEQPALKHGPRGVVNEAMLGSANVDVGSFGVGLVSEPCANFGAIARVWQQRGDADPWQRRDQ